MRFESETEMRVLSLRERLVADRDTYLRQLDRIGAGGASNGIGLNRARGDGSDPGLAQGTREVRCRSCPPVHRGDAPPLESLTR